MKTAKVLMLANVITGVVSGCASYRLPVPDDYTPASSLKVSGAIGFNQKQLMVGDYVIAINRGSTNERDGGTDLVRESRKRQTYNFVMRKGENVVFTGGCTLAANETTVAAPAGIQITASGKAALDCELLPNGTGRESWKLKLGGDPDNPLNGDFHGREDYTLEGIGTAIGSTKYGPTGGYHIKQNGKIVATVQTTSPRAVNFAEGMQSDPLIAAAVVLLLIDESVRDLDD
jgi:hypothetical protein